MISAWHLLWIIPLSAYAGMFITSLCVMARRDEEVEPPPTWTYKKTNKVTYHIDTKEAQ